MEILAWKLAEIGIPMSINRVGTLTTRNLSSRTAHFNISGNVNLLQQTQQEEYEVRQFGWRKLGNYPRKGRVFFGDAGFIDRYWAISGDKRSEWIHSKRYSRDRSCRLSPDRSHRGEFSDPMPSFESNKSTLWFLNSLRKKEPEEHGPFTSMIRMMLGFF